MGQRSIYLRIIITAKSRAFQNTATHIAYDRIEFL